MRGRKIAMDFFSVVKLLNHKEQIKNCVMCALTNINLAFLQLFLPFFLKASVTPKNEFSCHAHSLAL